MNNFGLRQISEPLDIGPNRQESDIMSDTGLTFLPTSHIQQTNLLPTVHKQDVHEHEHEAKNEHKNKLKHEHEPEPNHETYLEENILLSDCPILDWSEIGKDININVVSKLTSE
jgi:hypothetical protein